MDTPSIPADSGAPPEALSGRALTGLVTWDNEIGPQADSPPNALVTLGGNGGIKRWNGYSLHSLLTQANLCRMRGQFTEAVDYCVVVLRAHPGNATAHSLLGDIYRDQNKLDDAIQWFRMAVELRPNSADQAKLADMERERQRRNAAGT